jgi:MFS family permease
MYGSFFASLSIYIGYFYIQLFAIKLDIGQLDFSAYFVTLLNAGSVPGRLITNYLADRLGCLNIQIAMSALTTIIMFAWMGVHDMGGLVVFSLFYGASTGGIMAMFQPVTVALSSDPSRIGTRMGMVTFTAGFAVLVGPPIGGAILGDYSRVRWFAMIGYAGGITSIATVLFAIARMKPSEKTTTTKELAQTTSELTAV